MLAFRGVRRGAAGGRIRFLHPLFHLFVPGTKNYVSLGWTRMPGCRCSHRASHGNLFFRRARALLCLLLFRPCSKGLRRGARDSLVCTASRWKYLFGHLGHHLHSGDPQLGMKKGFGGKSGPRGKGESHFAWVLRRFLNSFV